ncbi:protein translocase subunit SecF [soil metagenome]
MRRLFANAHYDFINRRKAAYVFSGIALALCIGTALIWQLREGTWLNYGVDFTGGAIVQVRIASQPSVADVRNIVTQELPGSQVTSFGGDDEFLIRTPLTGNDATTAGPDAVIAALRAAYGTGDENVRVDRREAVSSKVGGELQTRALLAILISFVATLIYLAFRFEWRFGVAAIIATLHDIILALGLMAMLRMEISLPTVAAFLTIVGYSLNDTIVIFDRIRENLQTGKRVDFIALLNKSINETLPRTVLTSGTTLLTLLSLYLFGGAIIRDFALILIAGILLGTYSSIFVAAPALLEVEKRFPHEPKKKKPVRDPRARTPAPSRV